MLQTLLALEETSMDLMFITSNIMALMWATLKLLCMPTKVVFHPLGAEQVASQIECSQL